MIGIKLATGLLSAVLVTGGMVALAPNRAQLTANQNGARTTTEQAAATAISPAAIAALCAGFPDVIVGNINQLYDPQGQITFDSLPPTYDITQVMVRVGTGECALQPPERLPVIGPGQSLRLQHAIGVIDLDDVMGQGLPFYVIVEKDGGPTDGSLRVFVAIRLPRPTTEGQLVSPPHIT